MARVPENQHYWLLQQLFLNYKLFNTYFKKVQTRIFVMLFFSLKSCLKPIRIILFYYQFYPFFQESITFCCNERFCWNCSNSHYFQSWCQQTRYFIKLIWVSTSFLIFLHYLQFFFIFIRTPLHYCSEFGFKEGAKLLLDAGASINIQTRMLETPLITALISGQKEMVHFLLNSRASVEKCGIHIYFVFFHVCFI